MWTALWITWPWAALGRMFQKVQKTRIAQVVEIRADLYMVILSEFDCFSTYTRIPIKCPVLHSRAFRGNFLGDISDGDGGEV